MFSGQRIELSDRCAGCPFYRILHQKSFRPFLQFEQYNSSARICRIDPLEFKAPLPPDNAISTTAVSIAVYAVQSGKSLLFPLIQAVGLFGNTHLVLPSGKGVEKTGKIFSLSTKSAADTAEKEWVYHYTDSEAIPDAKVEEIRQAIGMGGVLLNCDSGAIWLKWGVPWCQSLVDETNRNIKRRYINITAEYFTL